MNCCFRQGNPDTRLPLGQADDEGMLGPQNKSQLDIIGSWCSVGTREVDPLLDLCRNRHSIGAKRAGGSPEVEPPASVLFKAKLSNHRRNAKPVTTVMGVIYH